MIKKYLLWILIPLLYTGCSQSTHWHNAKVVAINEFHQGLIEDGMPKVYISDRFFKGVGLFNGTVVIKIEQGQAEITLQPEYSEERKLKLQAVNFDSEMVYFTCDGENYFGYLKDLKKNE